MRRYYFRVDGGNIYSIATGHIMRCLKLAEYIKKTEEAEISFIMRNYTEGTNLVNNKFKVISLDINTDTPSEIGLLKSIISKDSYFICDLRNINNEYISQIKKNCRRFILFDDLGIKNISPDILINPTPFCNEVCRQNELPNSTLLSGEKFFFINETLVEKSYVRNFEKQRLNIMASFGGADPCNITEFFIKHMVPQLSAHNISIILGPAYANKEEIFGRHSKISNVKFYLNIWPLDELFLQNDIAFVCAGDTCIESCASGAATLILSSINYERKLGELLHKKGMAYFIADIEDIKRNKINEAYLEVLKDPARLMSISQAARHLIDGRGQERIYQAIVN